MKNKLIALFVIVVVAVGVVGVSSVRAQSSGAGSGGGVSMPVPTELYPVDPYYPGGFPPPTGKIKGTLAGHVTVTPAPKNFKGYKVLVYAIVDNQWKLADKLSIKKDGSYGKKYKPGTYLIDIEPSGVVSDNAPYLVSVYSKKTTVYDITVNN